MPPDIPDVPTHCANCGKAFPWAADITNNEVTTPVASDGELDTHTQDRLQWPDKVTLEWLWHHLPVRIGIGLGALLVGVFTLGARIGATEFARQIMGLDTKIEVKPAPICPSQNSALAEQLKTIEADYNTRTAPILQKIADQESAAGSETFVFDRQNHVEAADRLRKTLETEHEHHRQVLQLLSSQRSADDAR